MGQDILILKFKDIRPFISVIDRISICMVETLQYENFTYMKDVPESYDDYYLYGIGRTESEFLIDKDERAYEARGKELNNGYFMGQCIEILLSEIPKDEFPDLCTWSEYAYARVRFPNR